VIPQHQLLGVRMQVHLLVHPIWHRVAVQVVLQQRQRYDQRQQPLAVVLDETQKLKEYTLICFDTGALPWYDNSCLVLADCWANHCMQS
jgi:hypothetical protein